MADTIRTHRLRLAALVGLLVAVPILATGCTSPVCFGDALGLQDIRWTRSLYGTSLGQVEGYLYHRNCGSTIRYVEVWAWFYDNSGQVVHKAWTNLLDVRPNERRYWRIIYDDRPEFARVDVRWLIP